MFNKTVLPLVVVIISALFYVTYAQTPTNLSEIEQKRRLKEATNKLQKKGGSKPISSKKREKLIRKYNLDRRLAFYGTADIYVTNLNNLTGYGLGGKLGVLHNRGFAIGGFAKGMFTSQTPIHHKTAKSYRQDFWYVGGFVEKYLLKEASSIQFSIPFLLGFGSIDTFDASSEDTKDIRLEYSGTLVFEMGINIEYMLKSYFVPVLHIGYRKVFTSIDNTFINPDQLSSFNIGLTLKFGNFY